MNGKVWTKETAAYAETGVVWGASIPYPPLTIFESLQWGAFDNADNAVPFEAYLIRQLVSPTDNDKLLLNIRFRDRSNPPLDPKTPITVRFTSP